MPDAAERTNAGPQRNRRWPSLSVPRSCPCRDGGMPRKWQRSAWFTWLSRKFYVLGLSSGGCWSNQPVPHECYVKLGGRPLYVLGISRDQWRCLIHAHHWPKMLNNGGDFGMCGICYPCPECGSQTDDHFPNCEWWYPPSPPVPTDFTIRPFSDYVSGGSA